MNTSTIQEQICDDNKSHIPPDCKSIHKSSSSDSEDEALKTKLKTKNLASNDAVEFVKKVSKGNSAGLSKNIIKTYETTIKKLNVMR